MVVVLGRTVVTDRECPTSSCVEQIELCRMNKIGIMYEP